jgi:ribose transport system substrate-binding protein
MKVMKKVYVVYIFLAIVMIASLCVWRVCNMKPDASSSSGGTATTGDVKYRIGFISYSTSSEFWNTMAKGMKDKKDEYGVELIIKDGNSGEVEKTISAIEDFITMDVDAIVLAIMDPKALRPAIQKAIYAGITIIAVGNNVEGSSGFFSSDQYAVGHLNGEIAGQWIIDNLESDTKANVITLVTRTSKNMIERERGMIDGLLSLAPKANIVKRLNVKADMNECMSKVEDVLTMCPKLNVIIGQGDLEGLAAYEAMVAAGKKAGEACIVGNNGTSEECKKIKENTIYVGTVYLDPYQSGVNLIPYTIKAIKEGPQKPMYDAMVAITKANVDDYIK